MRDLILLLIVCGSLPFILRRPWLGVLMWCWIGFMNPHRYTWGFAYEFPFAALTAAATLAGLLFTRDRRAPQLTGTFVVWVLFVLWLNVTTPFALHPEDAAQQWDKVMKIQLFTLITMVLIHRRDQIVLLVGVVALSLGFFGIKGGVFALATGGAERVWGPPGSFIEGNNEIGLALTMTIPLMRFLQLQYESKRVRLAFTAAMLLTGGAILATHSRGAFLAGLAMVATLVMKSRHRLAATVAAAIAVPFMIAAMPENWTERMMTIKTYEQDGSAMGRINAWWFAFNLAKDHPLVGGGFEAFRPDLFLRYAPDPLDFHDAHSIYFEVMGEHGFVGFALFLALGALTLLTAGRIQKMVRNAPEERRPSLIWVRDLASMIQVSLIGYAVGGAFLGLAYFDLYYTLVALTLILRRYLEEELRKPVPEQEGATPAAAPVPASVRPNPYTGGPRAPGIGAHYRR